MADRTYRWILVSIAVIGLSMDQATKYGVFRWLYKGGEFSDTSRTGNEYDVVPGWFKLIAQFDRDAATCDCGFSVLQTWSAPEMPRVNHGALFGIGQKHKGTANNIFAIISVIAAIGILVWGTQKSTSRERGLMVALGLILGGTIGNMYDRIVFGGVRDFLYFYKIEWPVFNVADCCLVVGAALLVVQAIFVKPAPEQIGTPDGAAAAPEPQK